MENWGQTLNCRGKWNATIDEDWSGIQRGMKSSRKNKMYHMVYISTQKSNMFQNCFTRKHVPLSLPNFNTSTLFCCCSFFFFLFPLSVLKSTENLLLSITGEFSLEFTIYFFPVDPTNTPKSLAITPAGQWSKRRGYQHCFELSLFHPISQLKPVNIYKKALQLYMDLYEPQQASFLLEKLSEKAFPLKPGTKQGCLLLPLLSSIVLAMRIKRKKKLTHGNLSQSYILKTKDQKD